MELLKWCADYSVGINEIDEQHMAIIVMINKIYAGIKTGKGNLNLAACMGELVNYTAFHFRYEEKLLERNGYPQSDLQKQQHKELIAKLMMYKVNYEAGISIFSPEIITFLKDWFVKQIIQLDKNYSPFLQNKILE